jgi:hypothetical protein
METPTWLTPQQFAESAQLNVYTLWHLVREKKILAQPFGRSVRISEQALVDFGRTS